MMTHEQAIAKLRAATDVTTGDLVRGAQLEGELWGNREFREFRDQNSGKQFPEWTLGEWAGSFPRSLPKELQDAYELVVDFAARDEWNRMLTVDVEKLDEYLTPPAKVGK